MGISLGTLEYTKQPAPGALNLPKKIKIYQKNLQLNSFQQVLVNNNGNEMFNKKQTRLIKSISNNKLKSYKSSKN